MKNLENKVNKKEYAYNLIRERIINGTYSPGHRIIINQLAKEFSTSAIPIREALRQLEAEYLIEYKQFSGAVVTQIDEAQYLEALTVLAVLVAHATAISAEHFPNDRIEDLIDINKRMAQALDEYDFVTFGDLNRKFHSTTYEYCQNQYLLSSIAQVHNRLDNIRRTGSAFIPPRAVESIKEHQLIIDLIKNRASFEEVENYVKIHNLNTVTAYKKRKQNLSSMRFI